MTITFLGKKGKHLDTIEKFYIYQETKKNNQINDKHTVLYNKIFETIIENKHNIEQHSTMHS
jgi:endo-alpha-1,4-polygalactosaminidase (GH114 family)